MPMSMDREQQIEAAIRMRDAGQLEQSRILLMQFLVEDAGNSLINYHLAWTLDRMGLETEAAPYYERAIAAGLAEDDLRGALLGLGSTYRIIGCHTEAVRTLADGVARFPDDGAMRTFYALALQSAGEHTSATREFLRVILASSTDPHIARYRVALAEYMEHPDECWHDGASHARP